jgi:hypothetical protein
MLDEPAVIGSGARLTPKPGLEHGERAILSKPGLKHDDADGQGVKGAEGQLIDPGPATQVAHDDGDQATDHKDDEREMDEQDDVCKKLVHGGKVLRAAFDA